MFLHKGTNILINSVDIITSVAHLRTISNIEIPAHSFLTIPTKKTGKCTTNLPCIHEVEINEILGVKIPPLAVL